MLFLDSLPAPESSYCLFETQDEKNPTIERIADTLLPSVEAVAKQWFTFRHVSIGTRRLFLPVIVTNATLYTCTFDAEKVSMADGGLSHGDFQEVPVVRFRKGLAIWDRLAAEMPAISRMRTGSNSVRC